MSPVSRLLGILRQCDDLPRKSAFEKVKSEPGGTREKEGKQKSDQNERKPSLTSQEGVIYVLNTISKNNIEKRERTEGENVGRRVLFC